MVKGSCLCGGVRFEIDGNLQLMANCHCSMCRKHHGAPFVTYVGASTSQFRWVKGRDLVTTYASSERVRRGFCRICGSNLPVPNPAEQTLFIPAGSLDDDPGTRPQAHIFVASRAPWLEITDDLPQFDEYPPGFGPEAEGSGSS